MIFMNCLELEGALERILYTREERRLVLDT